MKSNCQIEQLTISFLINLYLSLLSGGTVHFEFWNLFSISIFSH